MYFGGPMGITKVNPANMQYNNYQPPCIITRIKKISFDDSLDETFLSTIGDSSSKNKSRNKDALTIRSSSRKFALEALEKQKLEFLSWGIMGNWTNPYLTMDKEFIKSQLQLFFDLMKKGYIYQRFMPVYWSPSSRTALAESELEYNQNVS